MRTDPSDARPDPERLLRQAMAQERQAAREKLKIFLGYASGVGKTMRMLDEARRRHERGQDVVVGIVQAKRPPEADALLAHLEVIPPRIAGSAEVLDVEALLRRRPAVCIVDGLAYDNPAGSRNATRWQDVQELVRNGIAVITSLNIQYIEEEAGKVERITGKRAAQTVPKRILSLADEIVVVDAPSGMLVERTGEADADPEQACRLAELREMTLLLTAEAVDRQLEDFLQMEGGDPFWSAHERILVCITPRANSARMLASGRRNADRFRGDLLVVYVEQPNLSPRDRAALDQSLEAARQLGAEIHVLEGEDPIETILHFARTHRITQLFAGHSLRESRWQRLVGGPLDRLIRGAEGIDVRMYPH
jgi:two-component system, OmpR family, sensor histidine kinase KdpD